MNSTVMVLVAGVSLSLGQMGLLNPAATWDVGVESPARIAVTASEVLVADSVANTIERFDLAGNHIGTWSVPEGPAGIAVHPDGRIFVSRIADGQVAVHDASFAFLRFIDPVLGFTMPTDLAIDPVRERLLVVDTGADRYMAFDTNENLVLVVGVRGNRPSEFKAPTAIAVDTVNDRVLVSDVDNYRVQVFSPNGAFLFKFGYRNIYVASGDEGWMPRTSGIAVDALGRFFVTDGMMGTVRAYSPTGALLGKVAEYGTGPGQLQTPGDIAIDGTGRVLVANTGGGTVEVYDAPALVARPAGSSAVSGYNLSPLDVLRRATVIGRNSTLDDTLATPGWDPPHMLDDVICGRCHGIAAEPGGHEGLAEGQANLCFSCHTGSGIAPASQVRPSANLGMSHAWGVPAVNATYGSDGPTPGGVLDQHLDAGDIKCATCHEQHNNDTASPFLRAQANAMCRECHSSHADHGVGGPWQPVCMDCHAPHDLSATNLSLIRGTVQNQTLGIGKPVVFTATSGAHSFDDGDPAAYDGICQVCHTNTHYHRDDGSTVAHFDGQDCTGCHPHDNGFLPSGGGSCTACHAAQQGIRRPIVGEFPVADAHAHYGAELTDDACLVCHSVATHMNGFVELVDADDNNTLYSFQQPGDLTSDPDLSDFCASCHDEDGATRLASPFDPFGGGNAPPDVATKFKGTLQWNEFYTDFCFGDDGTLRPVTSHHDISDADQAFSGAKIECLNCHGSHNASASQPLADPYDTLTPWTGGSSDFCLACHGGGFGPQNPNWPAGVHGPVLDVDALRAHGLPIADMCTNGSGDCSALRALDDCEYQAAPWYMDYIWTYSAHGLDSKRGWPGYSGAPGAVIDCLVCHDPHGSYTPTNTQGNPYMIRDQVDGTPFVDDGYRVGANWTGPPWDTFGTSGDVVIGIAVTPDGIAVDWGNGLCVKCHADWEPAQHFHDVCIACQTCHSHGSAWGEHDWVGTDDSTPCPVTLRSEAASGGSAPPIHMLDAERSSGIPLEATEKEAINGRPTAVRRPGS